MHIFLETICIVHRSLKWKPCFELQTLALLVKESDLEVGRLYPPLSDIRNVSLVIAKAICEEAYQNGKILHEIAQTSILILIYNPLN